MSIIAKGLSYTYNKKTPFASDALKNVNLNIEDGDFFGIIGHTGSGKSTFLQHLNGLIKVESGSLTVGEFDLNDKKCDFKKLRSKVGMVFQYPEYQLFADTVFSDIAFGLSNFSPEIKGKELELRVAEAAGLVGLDYNEVKDKSPFDLSGGQKRRAAIAGVIITRPEILVLDEPAAGLDPMGKREIMRLLKNLHKTSCRTIIIVSHDMDEIAESCRAAAVFQNGEVVAVAPPGELFKDIEFLTNLGLDVPVTAKIWHNLKQRGIEIPTDFKRQNFIENAAALLEKKGGGL